MIRQQSLPIIDGWWKDPEADKGEIRKVQKDTKFTRPNARGKTTKPVFYKCLCADVGYEKQLCNKGVSVTFTSIAWPLLL